MKIEISGRNLEITDEIREQVAQRFARIGRQVVEPATLEIELTEEKNPAITDRFVAEATLYMKRATLRCKEAHPELIHAIHHSAEDIRRQVKRHKDKLRGREKRAKRMLSRLRGKPASPA